MKSKRECRRSILTEQGDQLDEALKQMWPRYHRECMKIRKLKQLYFIMAYVDEFESECREEIMSKSIYHCDLHCMRTKLEELCARYLAIDVANPSHAEILRERLVNYVDSIAQWIMHGLPRSTYNFYSVLEMNGVISQSELQENYTKLCKYIYLC